ncbi:MAG: rod shape-determining protein MreD [Syntrophorhabdus sp. PtaB.Bin184]|jgi:rod shape-determining protein MreD|nr:MAG: rod shape-determining protein MreD [Syntrophorhabdus sp. PtaB.Bin184]
MKTLVYIILGIVLLLIETVISPHVSLDVLKPELGLPIVLYATFFLGARSGLVAAVCIGLAEESLSAAPGGSLLFTTIFIYLIAVVMRRKFFVESKYSFAYLSSASVVVQSLLFLALTFFARGEANGALNILFYTIPNAIVTGFVSILLFSLIEQLNETFLERN